MGTSSCRTCTTSTPGGAGFAADVPSEHPAATRVIERITQTITHICCLDSTCTFMEYAPSHVCIRPLMLNGRFWVLLHFDDGPHHRRSGHCEPGRLLQFTLAPVSFSKMFLAPIPRTRPGAAAGCS